MNARSRLSSVWEYAGEIICAGLFSAVLFVTVPSSSIADFMDKTAREFDSLVLVLFSASLAIWLTFVNITGSEFGGYLRYKGCLDAYNWAFLSAVVVYFLSSLSLILAVGKKQAILADTAVFFLIYGFLNLATMIRNGTGLIRLYSKFREEARKIADQAAKRESNH